MQSTSAHYWCVFLSLLNCIAEVCTYPLLLCTVTAVYWGECTDNERFHFASSEHVRTYVLSLSHVISCSCVSSDRYNIHPHSRTHFHTSGFITYLHMHMCVSGHQCVAIVCADCFVFPSLDHVWSVCIALTLVISCECPLFTVGEGVMWWKWHF